ncbi:HAD-IIIC family phosphatase [Arhodomonas sp. AD133]|uniref:HAD-IIIC family phosphatase n=1 Tax=Arhodomonas sp. AD133 TaxID=3415009 RepID=UPI003EBB2E5D
MNSGDQLRGLVVADFNAANLLAYLRNHDDWPAVVCDTHPYGQVVQTLLGENGQGHYDFAVVWTRPESMVPAYRRLLRGEEGSVDAALAEVDEFVGLVTRLAERADNVLIPTWHESMAREAFSLLGLDTEIGPDYALLRMNARLVERVADVPGLQVLNAANWFASAGESSVSHKLWYLSKVPFGNRVFKAAAASVKSALRGIRGRGRKLVAVDLDNTLWGGTVGDVGWEQLRLGGHDPLGEAFADVQRLLADFARRGVLLAIVSKNDEAVALEAIGRHPEMILRQDDFAGWRINWQDKAANLLELVDELNLGLDSVVFLDDNPVERARVAEALPDVAVPDLPGDPMDYARAIVALPWFNPPSLTREDRQRAKDYVLERKRRVECAGFESLDDWLYSLETVVVQEPLAPANLARACQLLNKTNQMNLATRRMSAEELQAWSQAPGHATWVFHVADKYGDSGLTGLLSVAHETPERMGIVDFLLSCRVMGRKVEETMVAAAVRYAAEAGVAELRARYTPTAKNRPCLEFWQRCGFESSDDIDFRWYPTREYRVPAQVTLRDSDAAEGVRGAG